MGRPAMLDPLAVHVSPVTLGQLEAATDPDADNDAVRSGGDGDGVRVHESQQLCERAEPCRDSTSGTSSNDIKLNKCSGTLASNAPTTAAVAAGAADASTSGHGAGGWSGGWTLEGVASGWSGGWTLEGIANGLVGVPASAERNTGVAAWRGSEAASSMSGCKEVLVTAASRQRPPPATFRTHGFA